MRTSLPAIALLALLPFTSAHAAADYLLEIDGLKGEAAGAPTAPTTELQRTVTTTVIDDVALPPRTAPLTTTAYGTVGKPFVLDGSRSTDDGVIRSFAWRQTAGPRAAMTGDDAAVASVTPPVAGTYVFELKVTDSTGTSSVAQIVTFIVGNDAPAAASAPTAGPGTGSGTVAAPPNPQPGSVDVFLEIDGVKGESTKGAEPPSAPLDVAAEPSGVMPEFSILLGSGDDDEESRAQRHVAVSAILQQSLVSDGVRAESVTIDGEKISTSVKTTVKIFGVIPAVVTAVAEIDASSRVRVRYPWWTFIASGKDGDGLGKQVLSSLSNVLKTKHDTLKNAIGDIR